MRPIVNEKRMIQHILHRKDRGGRVLEIAAGRAEYRPLFANYVGTDLATHPYPGEGRLAVYCDARRLPFHPGSFEMAFVVASLYLIPEPSVVLDELHAALQPGGSLLIFDYTQRTLAEALRRNHAMGHYRHFTLWTPRQLRERIRRAGFAQIRRLFLRSIFYDAAKHLFGQDPRWVVWQAEKRK